MCDGQHRPAIVVRVWPESAPNFNLHTVNLQVFIDGRNDVVGAGPMDGTIWYTSVFESHEKIPLTWHWPERDEPQTISGAGGINARDADPEPVPA